MHQPAPIYYECVCRFGFFKPNLTAASELTSPGLFRQDLSLQHPLLRQLIQARMHHHHHLVPDRCTFNCGSSEGYSLFSDASTTNISLTVQLERQERHLNWLAYVLIWLTVLFSQFALRGKFQGLDENFHKFNMHLWKKSLCSKHKMYHYMSKSRITSSSRPAGFHTVRIAFCFH